MNMHSLATLIPLVIHAFISQAYGIRTIHKIVRTVKVKSFIYRSNQTRGKIIMFSYFSCDHGMFVSTELWGFSCAAVF